MKANLLPDPERWSDRDSDQTAGSAEDVIGASFRQIRATTEPTDAAAGRWARRALATSPRAVGRRVWSMAIAGLILSGGGVVAAGVAWRAVATKAPAGTPADEPIPAAPKPRHIGGRREAPPDVLPDPEVMLEPRPAAPPLPLSLKAVRAPAHAPDLRPLTEPPPAPVADAPDEARLLARAFRHLRSEGDAAAALAALDERERQFGAGALATEAGLARAEALLLLGRADEALPILIGLRDPRTGLTPDVRVARAELLARAGRCVEAVADFDALLAPGATRATRERALYGRASCRLQLGQAEGAQFDLDQYLEDYPHGRFAPVVRAALEKLRRP
jgi:tetratricopeptide (TPR) repeat protein